MGDWTDEPEETSAQPPPPKKRLRLSQLARPLRDTTNLRFAEPVTTVVLKNTCSNEHRSCYCSLEQAFSSTIWTVKNFESLARSRPFYRCGSVWPVDQPWRRFGVQVVMPFRAQNTKNGRDILPCSNCIYIPQFLHSYSTCQTVLCKLWAIFGNCIVPNKNTAWTMQQCCTPFHCDPVH